MLERGKRAGRLRGSNALIFSEPASYTQLRRVDHCSDLRVCTVLIPEKTTRLASQENMVFWAADSVYIGGQVRQITQKQSSNWAHGTQALMRFVMAHLGRCRLRCRPPRAGFLGLGSSLSIWGASRSLIVVLGPSIPAVVASAASTDRKGAPRTSAPETAAHLNSLSCVELSQFC